MLMQIGLVDVLREEYGITPGGVLGHSAGEIACGYGDGCFTREQTVMVAYHRGRMCPEHNISGGLMAAVGLGADEAEARLAKHGKDSCVVGCDNSPNSVTLSGMPPTLFHLTPQSFRISPYIAGHVLFPACWAKALLALPAYPAHTAQWLE
jgi:acyl transferase domain-containing protein